MCVFTAVLCGGEINKDSGFLTSPNYPDDYPRGKGDDLECIWTITMDEGYSVALKFDRFAVRVSFCFSLQL